MQGTPRAWPAYLPTTDCRLGYRPRLVAFGVRGLRGTRLRVDGGETKCFVAEPGSGVLTLQVRHVGQRRRGGESHQGRLLREI